MKLLESVVTRSTPRTLKDRFFRAQTDEVIPTAWQLYAERYCAITIWRNRCTPEKGQTASNTEKLVMSNTQVTMLVLLAEFHEEPMPYDLATPISLIT